MYLQQPLRRACRSTIAASLACLIATALSTSPAAAQPADPTRKAFAPGAPKTAAAWTSLFEQKNDQVWSGSDQATSIKAKNGAVYWLWGDTILGAEDPATGAYSPGWRMIANTILVQRGSTLNAATAPGKPAIPDVPNPSPDGIENNGDEMDRFWPLSAVEHGGYLNVFAQRVRNTPGVGMGFDLVGGYVARFRFSGDSLILVGTVPTPNTGVNQQVEPQWGATVLKSDGYAYVYGTMLVKNPYDPHTTHVARVPLDSLTTPSAWRFWNGSEWGTDQRSAAVVTTSQAGSAAIINEKIVLLAKPWNDNGRTVQARISDNPQGPFTSRDIIDSPAGETPEHRKYVTYSPQLHPEQSLTSGKTLVSIAWRGVDLWTDIANDADLYKPRFYEIQF